MQHTLIPTNDRLRIHREYYTRVIIVLLAILSIVIILGIAGLAPTYIRAWLNNRTAQSAIEAIRGSKTDSDIDKASMELKRTDVLATFLSTNVVEVGMSQVIKSLVRAKGTSAINSIALSRIDKDTIQVAITGIAPTRDELLAFKNRIEINIPGSKVDLPIDQLARNINVPFSLQFSQTIQQ